MISLLTRVSVALLAAATVPIARAIDAPSVSGMSRTWQDAFKGDAGSPPRSVNWNIALDLHTNGDLEDYTASSSNLQLSGGSTLQIVPQLSNGQWTSGRIETKKSWTPQPGKKMRFQASFRMGDSANKQGMWPAFWMLGDSMRHGTAWPACGELDIFEQVNGVMTGYGTAHCSQTPGGICNEPTGLGESISIPNDDFHTWTLVVDRTSNDWTSEKITWSMDGQTYHTMTGSQLGDQATWGTLAHSPFYMILNVAVGGSWPGNPSSSTDGGSGNMMEVQYVAVYES